jgi:plastocyanin
MCLTMTKAFALLAALAVAAVGLVACGSDNGTTTTSSPSASANSGSGGNAKPRPKTGRGSSGSGSKSAAGGSNLTVTANPQGQLSWTPTTLSAKAGKVTVTLQNSSPVSHDIHVEGNGVSTTSQLVSGGSASLTANLKPGTYQYWCTVPGHKQAGMEGTLTVK